MAVLDSGTEYCNPDFDPSRFFQPDLAWTCVGSEGPDYPCCPNEVPLGQVPDCDFGPARDNVGHGTIVASIVGAVADNGLGIAGIDQECRILSVRVGGANGSGPGGALFTSVNMARAIIALETIASDPVYSDVRVINMSFELIPDEESDVQVSQFELAVNALVGQNRFVVAAAGNSGVGWADIMVPASFANVITVGGIDSRGWRVGAQGQFGVGASSTGASVDFMAPGMAHVALICQSTACPACTYEQTPCRSTFHKNFVSGTSFAAPMVCGAISLILGRAIELGIVNSQTWAGLTNADMRHILRQGARDQVSQITGQGDPNDIPNLPGAVSGDTHYGWGLIDIDASIQYLEENYPCSNPPC